MGTFINIIAENFDEIHRNFKSGLISKGYDYDEDLMSDTLISCEAALKDKPITKQEAIKYYWTSYINKFKTKETNKKPIDYIEDKEDPVDKIDDVYNKDVDDIYNIIISELQDEFGIKKIFLWELYECQGMSPKEIKNLGYEGIDNYAYFNKQIKRYIHNKLMKRNKKLKELVKYRKAQ